MARSLRLALASLLALSVLILLAVSPAAASSHRFAQRSVELLCVGYCSQLPPVPQPLEGDPFDFDRGLKAILDGADLTIETRGSVFVHGPVNASASIVLFGSQISIFEAAIAAPEVILETMDPSPPVVRPIVPPGLITIGGDGRLICGCLSTGGAIATPGALGDATDLGGHIELAAAVLAKIPDPAKVAGLSIGRDGDVYVDVSMVTLGHFKVKAGGAIVVAGPSAMPVPEPGTALLLGLGLAGLGHRRTRRIAPRAARVQPLDPR